MWLTLVLAIKELVKHVSSKTEGGIFSQKTETTCIFKDC